MDFERSIDGMVGRMLSWLTLTPIRPRRKDAADAVREDAADAVREDAADAVREDGEESLSVAERDTADGVRDAADAVRDAAEVVRRTVEKIAEKVDDIGEAVSEVAAEKVEEVEKAAVEGVEEVAAEADDSDRDAPDPLERKILEALAASEDGAAIKDLQRSTGGKPTTLRARLNRLIGIGRVQRRGQGMRTRYHVAPEGRQRNILAAKGRGDG